MTSYPMPLLEDTLDPPVLREIMRLQAGKTACAEAGYPSTELELVPPGDLVEIMALGLGWEGNSAAPHSRHLDWDGPGTDSDGYFYEPFALRHVPPKPTSPSWSDLPIVKRRILLPALESTDRWYLRGMDDGC
ncbi:hypothetical protein DFI02_106201 [Rhizobium sp. PP-F2F-G20b]|nr:hypothetical protein DFI02_106201 [Rhizobium sp. PP-F2F-G20b]